METSVAIMTDLCPHCKTTVVVMAFKGKHFDTKVFNCGYMVNDDGEVLVGCKKGDVDKEP